METKNCPKTWMIESFLATVFCCLPLGIIALISAAKVNSAFHAGKYKEALEASKEAKKWCQIAFGTGLVCYVLYLFMYGTAAFSFL